MAAVLYFVLSIIVAIVVRPLLRVDPNYRPPTGLEFERRAFGNESFFEREQYMREDMMQRMLHWGIPFSILIHMIWIGMGVLMLIAPDFKMALIFAALGGFFLGIGWKAIDASRARRRKNGFRAQSSR